MILSQHSQHRCFSYPSLLHPRRKNARKFIRYNCKIFIISIIIKTPTLTPFVNILNKYFRLLTRKFIQVSPICNSARLTTVLSSSLASTRVPEYLKRCCPTCCFEFHVEGMLFNKFYNLYICFLFWLNFYIYS